MQSPDTRLALADTLVPAARVVADVRSGRALGEALAARAAGLPAGARPAVQALAFDAMRGLGLAQALKAALAPRPLPDAAADALLLLALELLSVEEAPRYAAHTVVGQTVRAMTRLARGERFKALANAVLRTFLRERAGRLAAARRDPVAQWNYPAWWIAKVRRHYPGQWESILLAGNERPPMTLRVQTSRIAPADYRARLEAAGIAIAAWQDAAIVLAQPVPVDSLPGFREGWCSVQDAGAQRAAPLLDAREGMRVLDACAAPGGKTVHLLDGHRLDLLALDSDATRLARVEENLARVGVEARCAVGNAARPADWWDGRPFDRILLDAPCTASGIVRRHPDIRWLRRESDIAQLARTQRTLLDALWPLLAPGGTLLYVTCSIFPEEGLDQAQGFANATPDARALPAPGQLLPQSISGLSPPSSDPALVPHDGFFYALFEKR